MKARPEQKCAPSNIYSLYCITTGGYSAICYPQRSKCTISLVIPCCVHIYRRPSSSSSSSEFLHDSSVPHTLRNTSLKPTIQGGSAQRTRPCEACVRYQRRCTGVERALRRIRLMERMRGRRATATRPAPAPAAAAPRRGARRRRRAPPASPAPRGEPRMHKHNNAHCEQSLCMLEQP